MTSESQRDIPPQPKDTCPMINYVIKDLATIIKAIRGYRNADEDELRDMVDNVDTYINQEDAMEEIRTNAMLIRAWGEAWKQYALEIESELEELKLEKENSLDIQN